MSDLNGVLSIGRKLRSARMKQGLSLRDLAARAEVSASLLSQIETSKANPSVRSLHSIADALELPITYFFPEEGSTEKNREASSMNVDEEDTDPTAQTVQTVQTVQTADGIPDVPIQHLLEGMHMTPSEVRSAPMSAGMDDVLAFVKGQPQTSQGPVVRRGRHQTIELEGGVIWTRLTPGPELNAEYLLVHYTVGSSSGKRMSHHSGREFTYVLSGRLRLDLGFEQYVLEAGDSAIFDSTTPHRLANDGDVPMLAVTVLFTPEEVDG